MWTIESGTHCWQNRARTRFCNLTKIWADKGYIGQKWRNWFQWFCGWSLEIVKRSDDTSGFKIVPRRWVVERTFAWLDRCRRLSKDYEVHDRTQKRMAAIV